MIRGFHHAGLITPDLDRAISFYTELLEYEVVREGEWKSDGAMFNKIIGMKDSAARFAMLKGVDGTYLEIFEFSTPPSLVKPEQLNANDYGIRHLCFLVDDVAAVQEKLVKLGGSLMNEPVENPGKATASYCRDPFGNLLEFVCPVKNFPPD